MNICKQMACAREPLASGQAGREKSIDVSEMNFFFSSPVSTFELFRIWQGSRAGWGNSLRPGSYIERKNDSEYCSDHFYPICAILRLAFAFVFRWNGARWRNAKRPR